MTTITMVLKVSWVLGLLKNDRNAYKGNFQKKSGTVSETVPGVFGTFCSLKKYRKKDYKKNKR